MATGVGQALDICQIVCSENLSLVCTRLYVITREIVDSSHADQIRP